MVPHNGQSYCGPAWLPKPYHHSYVDQWPACPTGEGDHITKGSDRDGLHHFPPCKDSNIYPVPEERFPPCHHCCQATEMLTRLELWDLAEIKLAFAEIIHKGSQWFLVDINVHLKVIHYTFDKLLHLPNVVKHFKSNGHFMEAIVPFYLQDL